MNRPHCCSVEDPSPPARRLARSRRACCTCSTRGAGNLYDWQQSSLSVLSSDGGSMVQPHFVALDRSGKGPTLIFLEDTSLLVERVQQSKLAALGRLSASIAHEIRNPVGAMSHAAQLLAEASTLTQQERRLTDIITNNSERVSTIIDNVLQLSRSDSTRQERIELNAWLREFLAEFRQTMQIDEQTLRFLPSETDVEVRVDPTHLHQLLWNLCENALKYGRTPGSTDAIEIRTGRIADIGSSVAGGAGSGPRHCARRTPSAYSNPSSPPAGEALASGCSSRRNWLNPIARCCFMSRAPTAAVCFVWCLRIRRGGKPERRRRLRQAVDCRL